MLNVHLRETRAYLDALLITETHLTDCECTTYVLQRFQQYSLCGPSGKGGGILVFIKEAWLAETISGKFKSAEVLAFTISKPDVSFVFVAVYRPPNTDLHSFFDEFSVF